MEMKMFKENRMVGNAEVVAELKKILADSYTLYLKTQNYHWNVTGHQFGSLHSMFEEQYSDLAEAVDEIAERIRALNSPAPGSFQEFSKLKSINEASSLIDSDQMVKDLSSDNKKIADFMKEVVVICQSAQDETSADMLIERIQVHEKNAWMLDSSLPS